MKIALDASCLAVNPYSGLSEVVRNLFLAFPGVCGNDTVVAFQNYLRGARNTVRPETVEQRVIRIPRRVVELLWRLGVPPIDTYLGGVDVFHAVHIHVPPVKRIAAVLTVHDCRFLAFPDLYDRKEVALYRRDMALSLERVAMVAAVSEFSRQEIMRHFSFPGDRIRVIRNGFRAFSEENVGAAEAGAPFSEDVLAREYILYIGTTDPRKNLRRLIEAFAECRARRSDFPGLVIAGVNDKDWNRTSGADRGLADPGDAGIMIVGKPDRHAMHRLMKNAVALCYPSLYEGFGFPPLEAMSAGVPVVAAKGSSIPEICGDAVCYVDPYSIEKIASGLNRVVYESEYRALLVERGHEQVKKYSWERAAGEYMKLYREVHDA